MTWHPHHDEMVRYLSVLDTAPIVEGSTPREALNNTVELAHVAEASGYRRHWVAEHHGMKGVASSATAVIMERIASTTSTLRVGSGGIMLANHAPLVIAEQAGTLEAFHPGRIDLGLGRALGGNQAHANAVRREAQRTASSFTQQLDELLGLLDSPEDGEVRAMPAIGNWPDVWLIGSTDFSAQVAGERGLPYAFAHHLNPAGAGSALKLYRDSFVSSLHRPQPHCLVSVSVIAAETDERAEWLAGSTRLKVLSRSQGRPIRLPSAEDAARHSYSEADRAEIDRRKGSVVVGSLESAGEQLRELSSELLVDEIMVATPVHAHEDRMRSYELLGSLSHPPGGEADPSFASAQTSERATPR